MKRHDRPRRITPMQSLSPNLPPDTQREMLRRMLTIRRFEERASADYLAGKIYGVVHCYIGEEAGGVRVYTAFHRTPPREGSRRRVVHGLFRPPRRRRRWAAPARATRASP